MNKNKKKGNNKGCGHPGNEGGGGSYVLRERMKNGTSAQVGKGRGSNNERSCTGKQTGPDGDNELKETGNVLTYFSGSQSQEQRHAAARSTTVLGNAWGVTATGVGSGSSAQGGLNTGDQKREEHNSVATVLGLGIKGYAGPANNASSENRSKNESFKSTDSSSVRSNSGSDSKDSRHTENGESGELNNNGRGSNSSTKGGVTTCWKRGGGKDNSRAYAAAAGRALGIQDAKLSGAAGAGGAAVAEQGAALSGSFTPGCGQATSGVLLGEKREQQDKFINTPSTEVQPQPVEQQVQKGFQSDQVVTGSKINQKDANKDEVEDEKAATFSTFLQWQHPTSLDNKQDTPQRSNTGDSNSNNYISATKQVHTRKPCQLLRSQTSTEGTAGGHAAGGQRPLIHSYSMGATSTRPTSGGTRSAGGNRLRHFSSFKTASSDDTEESQPMKASALALQSALVSLLQVQEQNGGSAKLSKPVMPRRNLMCTSLLRTGVCANPERCNYAHNLLELQKKLELRKTSLCKYWMKGKCENEDCNFAHGEHELQSTDGVYKTTICKYWKQGACYSGSSCRHAHGEDDLRPERLPPHLERKRLQQLQKAPWRSSSFTPSTNSSAASGAAMASVLFDRTHSAMDVDRTLGRSTECKAGGGSLVMKSFTSGDLSNILAPLYRQDRVEDSVTTGDPVTLAAACILAKAAAARTGQKENVLREVLKNSHSATDKKPTDTANIISSAATVLSRAGILKNVEERDAASFARSVKQMPIMANERLQNNSTRLLENTTLLEMIASDVGLAHVARLLQQRENNVFPGVGSVGTRGLSPLEGREQLQTASRINEALHGGLTADLIEAAAAVVDVETKRGTGALPSSEVSVPTQDEGLLSKLKLLVSGICLNLPDLHGGSGERASADTSATPVAGGTNNSSDERDLLSALLNGMKTGEKRHHWITEDNTEASQSQLSCRLSPFSNTSTFSSGLGDISGTLRKQSRDDGTFHVGGRSSPEAMATGVAGTNSTRSSDLQAILNCGDILSGNSASNGNRELSSLRLPKQLIEQLSQAASPVVPHLAGLTKREADGTAMLPAVPSALLPRAGSFSSSGNIVTEVGVPVTPSSERAGFGVEKKNFATLTPGGAAPDGCRSYGAYFNGSSSNSVVPVQADRATKGEETRFTAHPVRNTNVSCIGDEFCGGCEYTGSGIGTAGTSLAPNARGAIGSPSDETGSSNPVSGAGGNEGGALGTGLGGSAFPGDDDSRFSSAWWRVTGAEATLLNNQRSSSTHQLEVPLNRSPTLPSMSDYVDEGGFRRGCTTKRDHETAPTTYSSCPQQQLQQRQVAGGLRMSAGEKGNTEEDGSGFWPLSPDLTHHDVFLKGTEGCRVADFEGGATSGGLVSVSAGVCPSSAATVAWDATCTRRRKEEQHELVARSVWEQTALLKQNSLGTTRFQPPSDSPVTSANTVFENVLAELSESVTALHLTAEEKELRHSKMVMQPLQENGESLGVGAVFDTSVNREEGRYTERNGASNLQSLFSVSSGPRGGNSCGLVSQFDDASLAASSRCLSTAGGVRSPSGGALSSSVDCGSPSALSDSGNFGKIERRLFDVGSSSSTIFPP